MNQEIIQPKCNMHLSPKFRNSHMRGSWMEAMTSTPQVDEPYEGCNVHHIQVYLNTIIVITTRQYPLSR